MKLWAQIWVAYLSASNSLISGVFFDLSVFWWVIGTQFFDKKSWFFTIFDQNRWKQRKTIDFHCFSLIKSTIFIFWPKIWKKMNKFILFFLVSIFFFRSWFFLRYCFDVKFRARSIYDVSRWIPSTPAWFWEVITLCRIKSICDWFCYVLVT